MKIDNNLNSFISNIKKTLKNSSRGFLHIPDLNGNEKKYLSDCIDSGYVSSIGPFVEKFEDDLARYTKSKYVVAVCNGTSALHLALKISGVKKNDEVLTPSLNFVAASNAIMYLDAVPHFIESEINTFNIDTKKLRNYLKKITFSKDGFSYNSKTKRKIKALVVLHAYGIPADMENLKKISKEFNLELIEDAAEAIGSHLKGKHLGTLSNVGILSFNGNKLITTGGGGALLLKNKKQAALAKHLSTTAKKPHQWRFFHDTLGFNYRMPNVNAALGCAQLERIDSFKEKKIRIHNNYLKYFKDSEFGEIVHSNMDVNFWINNFRLFDEYIHLKEKLLIKTNEIGLQTRPIWDLIESLPHFSKMPKMRNQVAQKIYSSVISLPSSTN